MKEPIGLGPWITWEVQTRNRSMSSVLGVPLVELLSDKPRLIRYMILTGRTISILWRYRGCWVFVQNPSIVLAFVAVVLKPLLRHKLVVDFHNSGLFPLEGKSRLLTAVSRFICRRADLSIVTNASLAKEVEERGGEACVVTDPLNESEFMPAATDSSYTSNYLLFVCSWADDEPWEEVLEAIRHVHAPVELWATGNYKKRLSEKAVGELPEQVRLLGFVGRGDYIRVLQQVRLVIDLTTRNHCLVCGAYEAVSAEVPMLLSDTSVNRETFPRGAVYTLNEPKAIAHAINQAIEDYTELKKDVQAFKLDYKKRSRHQIDALEARLRCQSGGAD